MFDSILKTIGTGMDFVGEHVLTWAFLLFMLPAWAPFWCLGWIITHYKVKNGHQQEPQGAYPPSHEAECLCRSGGVCDCR